MGKLHSRTWKNKRGEDKHAWKWSRATELCLHKKNSSSKYLNIVQYLRTESSITDFFCLWCILFLLIIGSHAMIKDGKDKARFGSSLPLKQRALQRRFEDTKTKAVQRGRFIAALLHHLWVKRAESGTHMMACFSVRELRYLWTWAWLTPYRANIRKIPPTPSVQKVWRSRGSGFRLQRVNIFQ